MKPRNLTSEIVTALYMTTALPARPVRYFDGGGLYLEHRPIGSLLWRYKYRLRGERLMALGSYPDVSLDQARALHHAARVLVAQQIDPVAERRRLAPTRIPDPKSRK